MAPDRLPRLSQRNVLAAMSRPMIAPNKIWGIGRLVLMAVIRVSGSASLRLSISLGCGDTTRRRPKTLLDWSLAQRW